MLVSTYPTSLKNPTTKTYRCRPSSSHHAMVPRTIKPLHEESTYRFPFHTSNLSLCPKTQPTGEGEKNQKRGYENSGEGLIPLGFSGGDLYSPTPAPAPPQRKSSQVPQTKKFIHKIRLGLFFFFDRNPTSVSFLSLHPSLFHEKPFRQTKWRTKCMTVPLALIWVSHYLPQLAQPSRYPSFA